MRTRIVGVSTCVFLLAGVITWAQKQPLTIPGPAGPIEGPRPALGHESAVLSGEAIGIRLSGSVDANGHVQGTLVARINGKWVDVVTTPSVVR
jgi:hypothetical protein